MIQTKKDYAYNNISGYHFTNEDEYIDKLDAYDFKNFDEKDENYDVISVLCFFKSKARHTKNHLIAKC